MKLTIELSETETQNLLSLLIAGLAKVAPPPPASVAEPPPAPKRRGPYIRKREAQPAAPLAPSGPPADEPAPQPPAPELDPEPAKRTYTGDRLPFDQLDPLVRSEMKRLSMDGRMPNHKLWDSERDPALPTLAAIILRYKCKGLADLADLMGLEPPLTALGNGRSAALIEA